MNILASSKQKRSTGIASARAQDASLNFVKSIIYITFATLCLALFIVVSTDVRAEEADEAETATTLLILAPGPYQGVWRDDSGVSNALLVELAIDDQSIKGELTLIGVEDYSGDKIRGKIEQNDDGSLSVEITTRDRRWRGDAIFDGQILVGKYRYEYPTRRGKRIVNGEWAAQRAQ